MHTLAYFFPKKTRYYEKTRFLKKRLGSNPNCPHMFRRAGDDPQNRPDDTFGNILTIGKYVSKAV